MTNLEKAQYLLSEFMETEIRGNALYISWRIDSLGIIDGIAIAEFEVEKLAKHYEELNKPKYENR